MPTTLAPFTIVRNTSGVNGMYFDFLGEHGATLDDGEDVHVPGDLWSLWAKSPIKMAALRAALDARRITVMQTPAVIVFDETAGVTQQLGADNGDPIVTAPDYGSYEGDPPS